MYANKADYIIRAHQAVSILIHNQETKKQYLLPIEFENLFDGLFDGIKILNIF